MQTIINLLTISRILAGVVIFILLATTDMYFYATLLFFLASISDFYDGYLARKYNLESQLGEILDPIADKILIIFVLIALSVNLNSNLLGFLASVIIAREIWVAALRDYNSRINNTSATKVLFIAKIKTTVQLFSILIYLIGLTLNINLLILLGDLIILIAAIITIYTGYLYTIKSFQQIK